MTSEYLSAEDVAGSEWAAWYAMTPLARPALPDRESM